MKKIFLIILGFTVIFISCNKKDEYTADIYGKILLFDRVDTSEMLRGNLIDLENMNDHSGIKVTFIKDKKKKHRYETTTGTDGQFELKDLPAGTYKVIFSKEGYSPFVFYDYQIIDGTESPIEFELDINHTYLRKIVEKIDCQNVNVMIRNDSIIFSGSTDVENIDLFFLFSTKKNISDTTFMDWYYYWADQPEMSAYYLNKSLDFVREFMVFDAGDTLYWRAYSGEVDAIRFGFGGGIPSQYFTNYLPENKGYRRVYGLSDDYNKEGYVVVPETFVSKLPDGVINPEPKTFDIQLLLK